MTLNVQFAYFHAIWLKTLYLLCLAVRCLSIQSSICMNRSTYFQCNVTFPFLSSVEISFHLNKQLSGMEMGMFIVCLVPEPLPEVIKQFSFLPYSYGCGLSHVLHITEDSFQGNLLFLHLCNRIFLPRILWVFKCLQNPFPFLLTYLNRSSVHIGFYLLVISELLE